MPTRSLKVIPKPDPETHLVLEIAEAGLKGDGPVDIVCGECQRTLAAGLPDERLELFRAAVVDHYLRRGGVGVSRRDQPLVLRCPNCHAYNQVTDE